MKTLLIALLVATPLFAAEGKWTPQQVRQLDPLWLKKEGLELAPSKLWDPATGTGLLAATVSTGGCSGGFVSPEGLFITNHHCLFGILQEHATPQNDVITNGFIARSRAEELTGGSVHITVPRRFVDVTDKILAAIPAKATDVERSRAIERRSTELVAECERQPSTRCKVASFDGGVQYVLIDALEVQDVRLVYAPPREVGDFGGEVDNWMWPRHAGDFAIGRAYGKDGQPYKSEHYFPISTKGASPGDFVMVLGYPGITYRSLTAPEMTERRDLWFTRRYEVYGEWIRIMEETTKGNPEGTIAVASDLKSLNNKYKNAEGQLAGFKRGRIVERHVLEDKDVLRWARINPEHAHAIDAYEQLSSMTEQLLLTWDRDFLLSQLFATNAAPVASGPKSLFFATSVVRSAIERQKNDADRDALYMERNLPRVRERLEREQKNYFAPSDKAILSSILKRFRALPKDQHVAALDAITDVDALYAGSKIFDPAERSKMLGETPEQLRARHDSLVDLGFALDPTLRDLGERRDKWDGMISRLRPEWRRAVMAHAGKPVAPDANGTLRVSFAHVMGYTPRDGVWFTPQTATHGIVEKHTGEEPFNAPKPVLEAATAKRFGRWADAKLKDVPVDFLADADTTGGNSGSPVVNGRGELVGVNFDRVWENVANDFGYNQDVGRNVSVDVRYLLWLLDEVYHADGVLKELGVK